MKNRYEIRGEVTAIFLSSPKYGDKETLISTSDLEKAMEFPNTWCFKFGVRNRSCYVIGNISTDETRTSVALARWILEAPQNLFVDHINHDTLDNTRSNLRIITCGQNNQNIKGSRRNSKSGVLNVTWAPANKKWRVLIQADNIIHSCGYYRTIEEAENAAKEHRKRLLPYSREAVN